MNSVKVLHAFKRYLPITENWAYRLIESTPAAEIHIFAKYFEKNNFYHKNWQYVDFDTGAIQNYYQRSISDRPLFRKVTAAIMLYGSRLNSARLLKNYIVDNGIQIVHSHFGPVACEIDLLLSDVKVKHVISFYGYDYEKLPFTKPIFAKKYRRLFNSASAFVCEGSHGAKTLEKMGCPRSKLNVVHLGLRVNNIPFVERFKTENCLRLVQVASITEKKGHYYTIRAFAEAVKAMPNMTLTIVGSAKSAEDRLILADLNEQIKQSGLSGKVKLLHGIDFSALYDFLLKFDVFIHPSCYAKDMDCEGGAPVVLLDAQASGMPVISTIHCDIPDEVVHESTGLLSDEKDVFGLTQSIKRFYRMSSEEFSLFSRNARSHVEKNYDIDSSGRQLLSLYQNAIN